MKFKNVSITGVAHVDAPHVITSQSLCEQIKPVLDKLHQPTSLLEKLTGIKERRFWEPGIQPSEVASQAAVRALEMARLPREKVGVLINTSVCKDYIEPSVASLVHGNLKLSPHCQNFDVGNACLAFLNGMAIAGNMIEQQQVDYALIVDGEGSRYAVEKTIERLLSPQCDEQIFRSHFATLTLGSGAAAMVLARSDLAPEGHRFLGGVTLAATEHNRMCLGQPDEMVTDTKALLIAGLQLASNTYELARKKLGWQEKELNELVLHQVSEGHTTKLAKKLKLDLKKIYQLYPHFGNIGPASIPIVISKALMEERISAGDRVALMGIGSGLNCAMMEVVW